jgi:hypothetical protein
MSYDVFAFEINSEIQEKTERLIRGHCDINTYNKLCGEIQGLKRALEVHTDILKRHLKEEED